MGEIGMTLQEKVHALYDVISDNFYKNVPDLKVKTPKGDNAAYNSCLLFSTLTALNNGKILLFGEYGGGKTTSAEYVLSMFKGIPLDIIQMGQIRGHPELTEEKTKGRPDLAKMNAGIGEEVIWEFFPLLPGHLIDEINRIPESKQSMILEGVGRGIWQYLREILFKENCPLFSTNNYADKGNVDLIPPMKDRFDMAVESKYPGVLNALDIALTYHNEHDHLLKNETIKADCIDILMDGTKRLEELPAKLEEYKMHISEKLRVETLSAEELEDINLEIRAMPVDDNAKMFLSMLITELNWSPEHGTKRTGEKASQHYEQYLFAKIENAGSRRMDKAIVHYARSLAWLTGAESVNLEHITTVAPYTMWHRIKWAESPWYRGHKESRQREDPEELHISRKAVEEVQGRMREQMKNDTLPKFFKMQEEVMEGKVEFKAFKAKYERAQHPVFSEIMDITERLTQW